MKALKVEMPGVEPADIATAIMAAVETVGLREHELGTVRSGGAIASEAE